MSSTKELAAAVEGVDIGVLITTANALKSMDTDSVKKIVDAFDGAKLGGR